MKIIMKNSRAPAYPLNCFFVLRRDLNNTGLVQEVTGTLSRQSTAASLSLALLGLVDHSNKILLILNKSRVRDERSETSRV